MKQAIFLLMLVTNITFAAESMIKVSDAWVREAPPGAAMLAAYMKIYNAGADNRVLTSIESPRFKHVMLHQSIIVDGIAKMHHQDSLEISAGGHLILEPGSYHLMMPAPDDAVQRDQSIEFTLHMKNGEHITVNATVKRASDSD